jgi:hypothetical protein
MIPPHVRTVEYLSPSSLRQIEEAPIEFYFRRLGPPEMVPPLEEQGFPAAVGSAFDAHIKAFVGRCPPLTKLLETVTCERERAIKMGKELCDSYVQAGALMGAKITAVEIRPEVRMAPGTSVPILGYLDAIIGRRTVLDWKVSGAGAPGTRSPHKGYARLWDTAVPWIAGAPHDLCGIPFEEINAAWATQLTIYGWLLGKPIRRTTAAIDELCVGRDGRLRVAQFRTHITKEFQIAVRDRLVAAWNRIQEERVVPDYDLETLRAIR